MIVPKKRRIKGLPWVRMMVLELDLVACDGFTKAIEDEEAGGRSALVDAAYEPSPVGLISGLADAMRQLVNCHND
jgi:hypothetical protein